MAAQPELEHLPPSEAMPSLYDDMVKKIGRRIEESWPRLTEITGNTDVFERDTELVCAGALVIAGMVTQSRTFPTDRVQDLRSNGAQIMNIYRHMDNRATSQHDTPRINPLELETITRLRVGVDGSNLLVARSVVQTVWRAARWYSERQVPPRQFEGRPYGIRGL